MVRFINASLFLSAMKHAAMDYSLTGSESTSRDLDHIISATAALKAGKELVEEKYEGVTVDVTLLAGTSQNLHTAPLYSVEVKSETDEYLRLALYEFFGEAGFPFFVYDSYDDVDAVLGRYGKGLQRKFRGGAVSKHVVDAE